MGFWGRVGDVGRRTVSGAGTGMAAGGPWGALGGAATGATFGIGENIAESQGWIEEGEGEKWGSYLGLGMLGQSGGGGGGGGGDMGINPAAFQLSAEQQAFQQQLQKQATGEETAPWVKAAMDQIRAQQVGVSQAGPSSSQALRQREAAGNIAEQSQRAMTEGTAMAQQMLMNVNQMENQMKMAFEKLRAGQALSLQELQMMQNQEQMRQQMAMMQGVASGIARGAQGGGWSGSSGASGASGPSGGGVQTEWDV